MPVFEYGTLEQGNGDQIVCDKCLFIMCSNHGAEKLSLFKQKTIGFNTNEEMRKLKKDEIKNIFADKHLRPEMVNRLDEIVIFNSISTNDLKKIAFKQIVYINSYMKENEWEYKLDLKEDAAKLLALLSYKKGFGVRPLLRNIDELIRYNLAEKFHNKKLNEFSLIEIVTKKPYKEFKNIENKDELKELIDFRIKKNL
jgi:ATP-dependent Clp protease ATP-binding subunit ClpC